jgi:hypothetical protein
MTSRGGAPESTGCSKKVPVFVWRNRRTLAFGVANIWARFNALPDGDGGKVQLFSPYIVFAYRSSGYKSSELWFHPLLAAEELNECIGLGRLPGEQEEDYQTVGGIVMPHRVGDLTERGWMA